jgi:nucleotide-binding universal stress UspA family protein
VLASRRSLRACGRRGSRLPGLKRVLRDPPTPAAVAWSITREIWAGARVESAELLDVARRRLGRQAERIRLETIPAAGDPAAVLVEVAGDVRATLLVVGGRGDDFEARVLLGSVAERVVRDAPCSVLIVR